MLRAEVARRKEPLNAHAAQPAARGVVGPLSDQQSNDEDRRRRSDGARGKGLSHVRLLFTGASLLKENAGGERAPNSSPIRNTQ